ncbi:MAG: imidazole glycerol phosphate synthase cyclase subunit [Candidatus Wildermuthbacteria bacterium RIFCSPHIGHO2_02_FULL_45_25]|uniref:imidazole glycerol-phosphate synthase n=1 Tax=Candidatus Wildermuthbacteria bacterium RIFCSPHIGHO2_02_FULL_45_25 TaxID=1802450 RepID=A0A1G2R4R3_9BACT|nr:MAG: imidazole glycerol phosphate synthase cyclase subunit [Candidatus Wildermuthbacteria bacterium RIFCSPHIGHO2_02_FULL_45_25]
MLKVRIIPTLLYRDFELAKGIRFDSWRRIGGVVQAVRVYNMRMVDELIFLDITATLQKRDPNFQIVDDLADECFMPLTVGGGVRTIQDVQRLLQVGADKVAMNTAGIEFPELIKLVANKFGSQCAVVSIDVKKSPNGKYSVYTHSGTQSTDLDPIFVAKRAEEYGAGEILLCSIDRDGTMEGYDIELIQQVAQAISIPIIASGGAGNYEHMAQAVIEGGASAVAAGSIFQFTQQTPREAKLFLKEKGIPVRL